MKASRKNILCLCIYYLLFFAAWSIWRIWADPFLSRFFGNDCLYALLGDGLIKSLIWALPALLLIRYFEKDLYAGLREMFTVKVDWLKFLPVFLLFAVYILFSMIVQQGRIAISPYFAPSKLITLLFVGITEELVFRGLLLNMTVNAEKPWPAIMLNALLFLLIHFPTWIAAGTFRQMFTGLSFLFIPLLSIIFSQAFLKSKSIWVPVALHMFWDLLTFLFF